MIKNLLLLTLVLAVPFIPAEANDDLAGIRSLQVVVQDLSHQAKLANLTRVSLETLVEDKLKDAGIAVQKGPVGLEVIVSAMETKPKSLVYDCTLNLEELARPVNRSVNRYNDPIQASTWSHSRLGISPRKKFASDVHGCVAALVDRFIVEYLAANQKNPSREVSSQ